jgi:polar amino acid transport system substrate-binding protein
MKNCGWVKLLSVLAVFCLCLVYSVSAQDVEKVISSEEVVAIVEMTAAEMAKDAPAVIAKINAGEDPFVSKDNPALYVFVYDKDVNMIAHPNQGLVGKNFKGKPDVKGKNFRDEIIDGAVANGKGWVEYAYQKPGVTGIFDKETYYLMVKGSDGKDYVLTCGKYKDKK